MHRLPTTSWIALIGLSLFALMNIAGVDFIWAHILYQWQGGSWQLQHHWLTEQVLHHCVRSINQMVILVLIGAYLYRLFRVKNDLKTQALGVLILSLLACFLCISLLKRLIPMECPWDLQQFGGLKPYIGLFQARPSSMPGTECFPAGHASIGFAWISLYFYYQNVNPFYRITALVAALCLGVGLGFVQQLRGAHFVSHDIASALICWGIAAATFKSLSPHHFGVSGHE